MRLLLFFTVLCFMGCYQVERNCKAFRTGHFYSEVVIDGSVYRYNNRIDSSRLRWINDCEVVFKTINPKNMAERKDIHLKILATTDTSYTFEYAYVGETKKQKGIAFTLD